MKPTALLTVAAAVAICCLHHRVAHAASGVDGVARAGAKPQVQPQVTIVMLVRDKAYALPYTLGAIERLAYNASQLSLAFYLDHTSDESLAVLLTWQRANSARYRSVQIQASPHPARYPDEVTRLAWTRERMLNVLQLRQRGLELARSQGSEFALFLDADALLTHPDGLAHLVAQDRPLLAPLLNCSTEPGSGANFWGSVGPDGFYARSPDFADIRDRARLGVFPVGSVHTAFLLGLRATAGFRFLPPPDGYPAAWPFDDVPLLHAAAAATGLQPELDNRLHFGVYATVDADLFAEYLHRASDLEIGAFKHALLEFHYHWGGEARLEPAPAVAAFAFPLGGARRLGFDRVSVINLARRPDRLERMRYALRLLGIEWNLFPGVDGRQLNDTRLLQEGVQPLAGYADPYHGRGVTAGEVGCFLSHHALWQATVKAGHRRVLVLEDDVRFGHNFEERLALALEEAERLRPDWELLYLGRKIMHRSEEEFVEGAHFLTLPSYTYWTLGYALTQAGARKLLAQRPLGKLVPVDEYLPIMFDRHPNAEWKAAFQPRDLVALSAAPLLLEPNYYVGMAQYVSDTEKSDIIQAAQAAESGTCSRAGGQLCKEGN